MRLQDYKKLMTMAFVNNTRKGFADWRDCGRLCTDVIDGLEGASEQLCLENRYEDLFELCNWTYIKWCNTDKDDSAGETQYFCECVYDIWDRIYRDGEQFLSHDLMLENMLDQLDGRFYDYMEDEIYSFILKHFKSEAELAKKEQFLRNVMDDLKRRIPENDILKYSLLVMEEYCVRVMADQHRPIEEIRDFLNDGDSYSQNELLAQIETEYGNYKEAIALYKKLIATRRDSYWSDEPRKALMDIYKKLGDTEAYNDELYNMMIAHTGNESYYLEYKALFTDDEWEVRWSEILEEFKNKLSAINTWLYIEGRYDIIMENAEPAGEMIIDEYGKILFKLYPERCLKVLANAADIKAQNSKNRRDYHFLAKTLQKISSHSGGKELAAKLAAKYRVQYPRRTAMIDELKRF
ncbi:MAG: hypothetical protein K6G24_05865 [Lachnospiraceae bacterium]|nr:hypothetical protein [Lachnospiraceae bacterium]